MGKMVGRVPLINRQVTRASTLRWLWPSSLQVLHSHGASSVQAEVPVPLESGMAGPAIRGQAPTTNLIFNPRFSLGLDGWVAEGLRGSLSPSSSPNPLGEGVAMMAADGDVAANAAFTIAASAGQTYSFQALVSTDTPLDSAAIRLWNESDGASLASPLVVSSAWQWLRIEGHEVTANEPLLCQVYPNLSGTTGVLRIAGAQLEAAPYATAYCDGDMGEGFAWTGTPHASPSTRAAGRLRAPLARIDPLYGALAAWVRPDWPGADGREHVVLHAASGSAQLLLSHTATGSWRAAWTAPTGTDAAEVPAGHDRDQPLLLVMQWTPARLELHLRSPGSAEASATVTRTVRPAAIPQGTRADLGRRTDAAEGYANAQLGPIAGFNGPLDASARRTLARLDRPWRWSDGY